jgi:outer membrane biosynthesis protein TonB
VCRTVGRSPAPGGELTGVAEQSHKDEMRAALQGDFARLRARQELGRREPSLRVDPPQPAPGPGPDPPVTPTPEPSPLPAPEPSPTPTPVPSPPPEPVPSPEPIEPTEPGPTEPEPDGAPDLDPAATGFGGRIRSLFGR